MAVSVYIPGMSYYTWRRGGLDNGFLAFVQSKCFTLKYQFLIPGGISANIISVWSGKDFSLP